MKAEPLQDWARHRTGMDDECRLPDLDRLVPAGTNERSIGALPARGRRGAEEQAVAVREEALKPAARVDLPPGSRILGEALESFLDHAASSSSWIVATGSNPSCSRIGRDASCAWTTSAGVPSS